MAAGRDNPQNKPNDKEAVPDLLSTLIDLITDHSPAALAKIDVNMQDPTGVSLLTCAINSGWDANIIIALIKAGADIHIRDSDGLTLLQKVIQSFILKESTEIAKTLIEQGADKNITDKEGNTLMHLAQSPEMVKMLAEKGCAVDTPNNAGRTPLKEAVSVKKIQLEKALRIAGASTNKIIIPEHTSIKEFQRKAKTTIIEAGALTSLDKKSTKLPTVPQVIESHLFGIPTDARNLYQGRAAETYTSAPILQPLMQVMAIMALKPEKNKDGKNKHFKMVAIYNTGDVSPLRVLNHSTGLYTSKNTVFAAQNPERAHSEHWGTLLHESTHYAMTKVFANDSKPWMRNNDHVKQEMDAIVAAIKTRWEEKYKQGITKLTLHERIAFHAIDEVFASYKENQYAQELIVKIPEIIGQLGNNLGMQWLIQNVPELVEFFKKHVNTAIHDFLKARHLEQYVDTTTPVVTVSDQKAATEQNDTWYQWEKQKTYYETYYEALDKQRSEKAIRAEAIKLELAKQKDELERLKKLLAEKKAKKSAEPPLVTGAIASTQKGDNQTESSSTKKIISLEGMAVDNKKDVSQNINTSKILPAEVKVIPHESPTDLLHKAMPHLSGWYNFADEGFASQCENEQEAKKITEQLNKIFLGTSINVSYQAKPSNMIFILIKLPNTENLGDILESKRAELEIVGKPDKNLSLKF